MRNKILLLAGLLLLLLLTACTSVKRFKSADYRGTDNALVDVELFSSRLAAESVPQQEMNLWNLSANAQTRLVQILDERYPDNAQFMNAMSRNYQLSGDSPAEVFTRKELLMVFSINKQRDYPRINDSAGRFSPADRIEYLKLTLEIPEENNLRFTRWNRYATEYGEVEIADVSFSRSLELDASGDPGGVDLSGKASLNRSEKQVIETRYLKLNGSLSETQVVLEEEGTRGTDLTGNISADISLEFGGFPERVVVPFFSDSGGMVIQFNDVLVPALELAPDTLFAKLTLEYIYRHVQSGWLTYAEWDDKVEYYEGTVHKRVPLFTKQDYLPGFYCIGVEQEERIALKVKHENGKEYLMQFLNYPSASRFLEWLSNPVREPLRPVFIGASQLIFKGQPVTPAKIVEEQLKVMPVH
ncbi:MAG: hypothetical protein E4H10_10550 [Bacteroidia bacterium]|nr:MAG: hypothetical protein E4H10_10550 [Bacteroidia bacterium]